MHRWWRCFQLLAICQRAPLLSHSSLCLLHSRRIMKSGDGGRLTTRYQHGWLRLVTESSQISSQIRKPVWSCLSVRAYSLWRWQLTSSTDHPRMAALKYSSSVNSDPLRISAVSQTDNPRFNLPVGQLHTESCSYTYHQGHYSSKTTHQLCLRSWTG